MNTLQKAVVVICDGLGDRPIAELGGLTPLEAAATPVLDDLAAHSECGLMCALGRGRRPGSDTSHLAIFGYDIDTCYSGRGPIEAAGVGLQLEDGDVALRANLGTVDDAGVIVDRRAGRILDVSAMAAAVDGMEIDGVRFLVRPGTAHRAAVVMRGQGLSGHVTDADPHVPGEAVHEVRPTDATAEASRTADILTRFLKESHEVLEALPENQQRKTEDLFPANFLLVRGAGQYRNFDSFSDKYGLRSCCIAGGGLYRGIASLLGMAVIDVPGATGLPDTDVAAKFVAAGRMLADHDFVFVHVKATDTLGEDGDFLGKKGFIEKIDGAADILLGLPPEVLVVITADHSTPCALKQHSADPVPILFRGAGVRVDSVETFGERSVAHGGAGLMSGYDVMPQVINLLGRARLIGA